MAEVVEHIETYLSVKQKMGQKTALVCRWQACFRHGYMILW